MSAETASRSDRKPIAGSHWEWIAAIVSLLLVLAAIGYLLREGMRAPESPPEVLLRVDTVIEQRRGFLVEYEARNLGRETAAAVRVEGTLGPDAAVVERSESTLDFLPGESSRRGGLFFTRDPRQHGLRIRATGYELP